MVLRIVYGMRIKGLQDEYVTLAQQAVEGVNNAIVPGVCWVEFFPILKYIPQWIPGAYTTQMAHKYRPIVEAMRDRPFEKILGNLVKILLTSYLEAL